MRATPVLGLWYFNVLGLFLCIPALFLFASGEKPKPSSWNRIKGTVVVLKDEILLDKVMKSQVLPREKGIFLFETGDSFSYTYKADALQLILGGKVLTIEEDMSINISCLYPGAKNSVDLPFRFFPNSEKTSSEVSYCYQSKSALVFHFGKFDIVFIDWNHNGYFDDFNEDRYLLFSPNTFQKTTITPEEWHKSLQVFSGFIKLPNEEIYLAGIKPAWELFLWKVSNNLPPDYLTYMGYLNHLRKLQGVDFVGFEESLISACEKHSFYCSKNGLVHEEDPAKDGYTPEGDQAGRNSIPCYGVDALASLKRILMTLYHRNYFLIPCLRKVSVGGENGIYTSDILSFSDRVVIKPILYPFPRQTGVLVQGDLETPNQFPEDLKGNSGTIIAIKFPKNQKPKFHTATIRQSQTNEEVPFAYTDCYKVPQEAQKRFPTNDQCIALFPRKYLDKGVIYEIIINYFNSPTDATKNKPPCVVKWQFKTE